MAVEATRDDFYVVSRVLSSSSDGTHLVYATSVERCRV